MSVMPPPGGITHLRVRPFYVVRSAFKKPAL
jgi:hypothetical protein